MGGGGDSDGSILYSIRGVMKVEAWREEQRKGSMVDGKEWDWEGEGV